MKRVSCLRMCLAIGILLCGAAVFAESNQAKAPEERLKFVLVLVRHGVRSPTWTNARLDEYVQKMMGY